MRVRGRCWQPTRTRVAPHTHTQMCVCGRGRRQSGKKGGKKGGKKADKATEWAAIDCLHCATNAAMAITKDSTGERIRCPGCKKQYRTSASNLHLVFTRHPSLAEAEQALNA